MYARTRRLSAGYGRRTILRDFSRIMDDQTYIITGPNGGGKSTLFRVLAGVRKIRNMNVSGEAEIYGNDPLKGPDSNIGVIFQEHFRRYLGATPEGEIKIHLRRFGIKGSEAERRIAKIAKERSLERILKRPMSRISDGEKLRVLLAALFAIEPKGFIFDEPLSSLDPIRATRVVRRIKSLDRPTLIFEHRREFFNKAHIAIVNGTLEKPKKRKIVKIRSRREDKIIRIKLLGKRVEIPLASRGLIPIRGPNGGGKTSLLRALFTSLKRRFRIVYVPSDPMISLHGPKAEDEAKRIFKGPIRQLSFGQKKELSVIAALNREADIYLLDEPFKGLDDSARERVLRAIEKKAENSAVYFATNERESIAVIGPTIRVESGEVYEESGTYRPSLSDSER